jgi:hypothetical protein
VGHPHLVLTSSFLFFYGHAPWYLSFSIFFTFWISYDILLTFDLLLAFNMRRNPSQGFHEENFSGSKGIVRDILHFNEKWIAKIVFPQFKRK